MSFLLKSFSNFINDNKAIQYEQHPPKDYAVSESDCMSCQVDCESHKQYPSYLKIDTESKLLNSVSPYNRHFLISTASSDWPERIEQDNSTLTAKLHELLTIHPVPWSTIITNTSFVTSYSTTGGTDIWIQPENIIIANASSQDAQLIYDLFIKLPLSNHFDINDFKINYDLKHLEIYSNSYDSMILVCSHQKRDKRCGVTAPILSQEFDHVLRELDIQDGNGGTTIMMTSHIGGHKFAGNVICYINCGRTGIWYGRVKSCHCRAIIEETIIKGKVIKELYRGSMKNSFGNFQKSKCKSLEW